MAFPRFALSLLLALPMHPVLQDAQESVWIVTRGPGAGSFAGGGPSVPAPTTSPADTAKSTGPVWGSDECSTPDPLPSSLATQTGYFTGGATTGVEGQGHPICDFKGTPLIENDVWFIWTAPATGTAIAYACAGMSGLDPRLAVYEGGGCPGSAPLECSDDDGCSGSYDLGAWVTFETHAGQPYLIQVGSYPGSPTGTGSLTVKMAIPSQGWHYQNEWTPFSMGGVAPSGGKSVAWMQRFTAKAGQDDLVSVQAAFGRPGAPVPLVNGDPATIAIWSDPDQDGRPHDAVLQVSVPTTIQNANTGFLNEIALPAPVHVQGKFFVGVSTDMVSGQHPAVFSDTGWQGFDLNGKSWIVGNATGPVDLECLACNDFAPASLSELMVDEAHFMVRARGGGASDTFCYGSTGACPCSSNAGPGEGCQNSSWAGALLWSTGSANVARDDLVLHAMHFAKGGGIALAMAGSQQLGGGAGIPMHAGLLCVGGTLHRYPAKFAIDLFAQDSLVGLSKGLITAGSTWNFQVWYRDAFGPCGFESNLSNALRVDFTP
jgi:hypothetical protein